MKSSLAASSRAGLAYNKKPPRLPRLFADGRECCKDLIPVISFGLLHRIQLAPMLRAVRITVPAAKVSACVEGSEGHPLAADHGANLRRGPPFSLSGSYG